jgi:hypothetical protein
MPKAWHASLTVADRSVTATAPSLAEMAPPFFCERLRYDLGFETLFGIHLLEAPVFLLQLLHACHQRRIHAAEPGAPLVERGIADAVLAAQLRHRAAGFGLLMAIIWLSVKRDVFM